MYDGPDVGTSFVDGAMNEPLRVRLPTGRVDGRSIERKLHEIFAIDAVGCARAREEVPVGALGMTDAHMAERIDDAFAREDAVRGDQFLERGYERSHSTGNYMSLDNAGATFDAVRFNGMTKDPSAPRPLLKTALVTRGQTQPLKDRTVAPRTFEFAFEEVPNIVSAFRRMVRGLEFDISEMAMTTYLCARAFGKPFTAIPVFPMRAFHHGAIVCSTSAGVRSPKDLEGKRVGVNRGYTVTTGLWARGILQHEYGVDLSRVTWVLSGDEHVAEYRPPPNVVSMPAGATLEGLLVSGDIAAAIGVQVDSPHVKPLIPHAGEAGLDALRQRGLYPINHTVVVKNSLLDAHPGLAADIFDAFAEAKAVYVRGLEQDPQKGEAVHRNVMQITGDPLPYGIEPNRVALEALVQYSVEQGIIPRAVAIEDLFPPSTRALICAVP
jgi:4,5-dihydroxyphthalate decarboxylase